MFEHLGDDLFRTTGGHRHGNLSVVLARHGDDGVDRFHLCDQGEILGLFFVGDSDVVDRQALFVAEHLEDIAGRHASERVKTVLGQMQSMAAGYGLPGAPVQWHRVGQGAVAVKDDSFDSLV
jgi:hypothetical protein